MKIQKILPVFSLFTLFLLYGCSSTPELISTTGNNIVIDGNVSDWGVNLKYFPDEKVALGVSNDNNYFYLCLTTGELDKIIPMFAGGFIVWLQPEKSDSSLGIKYPLHNIVDESRMMVNPERFREKGRGTILTELLENQNEIRILNKDKFPVTAISTADSSGLMAKLGYSNDQFVYELRVPLKTNKYGITASPGEKISVKFETEMPERRNLGGQGEGGMNPNGGMRRNPGGYGGERTFREHKSFEPIDFSVDVILK
jgi:hypothetical protein